MIRILYIAPGDNPHTWKWVGWFGRRYPGEVALIPYQAPVPSGMLSGIEILGPHILPFRIASITSWTEIGRVRRLVHEVAPRLLHVLWAYGSGTCGARADFRPTILSPWGSEITVFPHQKGLKGAIQRRLIVEALEKADFLTATSRFLAEAIHDLVPRRDPPVVLPYGVDTSLFNPDRIVEPLEFEWPSGAPSGPGTVTVGFFKALRPKYGPDFLVEAIAKAAGDIPGIRCVMAGAGEMRGKLVEQAKALGVDNRIVFPGRIPYPDMPEAMKGVDIFAMPSRYEELGVAALEASSMRKPVILTGTWGMREVAVDGETGYFIEPGDIDALAGFLVKLGREADLRQKLGGAGREFVRSNFEFERLMETADRYCAGIAGGSSG